MSINSPIINVMLLASGKISRAINRDFNELFSMQNSRNPLDRFLARTKEKVEGILRDELNKARSEFGIISNTFSENVEAPSKWIVNILDGDQNFIHALPFFAISIAVETNSEITAGLIFSPALSELYYAEKGKGAWLETTSNPMREGSLSRLRVSTRTTSDSSIVMTNSSEKSGTNIRNLGSIALSLAYLSSGRAESCVMNNIHYSSIAAGSILIREAGGIIKKSDVDANYMCKEFLASNC